jgi:hypothetical protein
MKLGFEPDPFKLGLEPGLFIVSLPVSSL